MLPLNILVVAEKNNISNINSNNQNNNRDSIVKLYLI